MKRFASASLAAAALAAASTAFSAPGSTAGSHFAVGVVEQADREARVVLLLHEPVAAMPAMSMQFVVGHSALFERMPAGQQLAFEFVELGGHHRVVNAIPLAQAATTHHAHADVQRETPGADMQAMRAMCEGMMRQMHGGKH